MTLTVWFWFFYVLFILFGGYSSYRANPGGWVYVGGTWLVYAILLFIIGLRVFGSPIK